MQFEAEKIDKILRQSRKFDEIRAVLLENANKEVPPADSPQDLQIINTSSSPKLL